MSRYYHRPVTTWRVRVRLFPKSEKFRHIQYITSALKPWLHEKTPLVGWYESGDADIRRRDTTAARRIGRLLVIRRRNPTALRRRIPPLVASKWSPNRTTRWGVFSVHPVPSGAQKTHPAAAQDQHTTLIMEPTCVRGTSRLRHRSHRLS